jgi:hypothetical protein
MLNVSGAGSLSGAFIVQYCSQCSDCTSELSKSTLQHFNNGNELRSDLSQSSFLRVDSSLQSLSTLPQSLLTFTDVGKAKLMLLKISNVAATQTLIYINYTANPPVTLKDASA